ncbi:hypothetical protein [Nocardia sp. bgisy118]|uniref:hypothetical protein n=1 Tax=Nocardia sp. bgisy118 TaxID=3413786 RepID=UPI003F49BB58
MSSVNPWAGTGLGGDAYPVLNEHCRQIYENGRPQYVHRGEPGFAERHAANGWMKDKTDDRDLSQVISEARANLRQQRGQAAADQPRQRGVERSR